MVRKFTKSKAIFPTDDSIRKIIFMSVKEISKKWTMPVRDWGLAYSHTKNQLKTAQKMEHNLAYKDHTKIFCLQFYWLLVSACDFL